MDCYYTTPHSKLRLLLYSIFIIKFNIGVVDSYIFYLLTLLDMLEQDRITGVNTKIPIFLEL